MSYDELLKILKFAPDSSGAGAGIEKLLSPRALDRPEDLHRMISTRFRYTGPGKWVKVLKQQPDSR